MAEIDTLEVKITASATTATTALNRLANSLRTVKTQLTNMKDGVSVTGELTKHFTEMNKALESISVAGMVKLENLTNSLNGYASALKQIKSVGDKSSLKNIGSALSGDLAKKISDVTSQLNIKDSVAEGMNGEDFVDSTEDVEDFGDAVDDAGDKIKDAGEKAKKSASLIGKFVKSLARIAFYRAIRSALKEIAEGFETGLKNAYYFSQQTGDLSKLAETLDRIKSVTSQMVNQLGSLWGEIKQFFAPFIEWAANKIREIAEWLTQLFAALNGDTVWKRALYEEQLWDDATESLKKYKHQLLGLDELNNLSKDKDTKKKELLDASEAFEYVELNEKFQKIANRWGEIKKEFEKQLGDWKFGLLGAAALAAVGAILLFATSHWFLGLGMLIASGIYAGKKIGEHWDEIKEELKGIFEDYPGLFTGIGAAAVALGAILVFSGANIPIGLGLLALGGGLVWTEKKFSGQPIIDNLEAAWKGIKSWWESNVEPAIEKAVGWIEDQLQIDINMDGKIGYHPKQKERSVNTSLGNAVKDYYGKPVSNQTIANSTNGATADIQELASDLRTGALTIGIRTDTESESNKNLAQQIYGYRAIQTQLSDMIIDKFNNSAVGQALSSVSSPIMDAGSDLAEKVLGTMFDETIKKTPSKKSTSTHADTKKALGAIFDETLLKANGGIANGSLFWAGESGAEFVGNIGSTSAVANTGQMTDAIYKAAYMGMSKALKENGGNGMAGFEPATTDDLFIAMRKKANNYNKMTGNSAFA